MLFYPWRREVVLLFFIFSDGTFIVLKENLGKALDQKLLLMNIIYQIQKDMFQQKDNHSGKQKAEVSFNYIAPAHLVIYNWTTRGRWHPVSMFVRVGPLRRTLASLSIEVSWEVSELEGLRKGPCSLLEVAGGSLKFHLVQILG